MTTPDHMRLATLPSGYTRASDQLEGHLRGIGSRVAAPAQSFADAAAIQAALSAGQLAEGGLYYSQFDGLLFATFGGVLAPLGGTSLLEIEFANPAAAVSIAAGALAVLGATGGPAEGALKREESPASGVWGYTASQGVYSINASYRVRVDVVMDFLVGGLAQWTLVLQGRPPAGTFVDLQTLASDQFGILGTGSHGITTFDIFRTGANREFRFVVRHDNAVARTITVRRFKAEFEIKGAVSGGSLRAESPPAIVAKPPPPPPPPPPVAATKQSKSRKKGAKA